MLVGGHERAPEVDDAEAQSLEAAHVPHAAGSAAGRCGVDAETAAEVAGAREVRVLRDVAADRLVVEHLDHVGLDDWRPVDHATVVMITNISITLPSTCAQPRYVAYEIMSRHKNERRERDSGLCLNLLY